MAQPPRPAGNGDNFVRHIVADPKNVPDVMLLYGYSGASSEEGHERLYLSPDLSAFVEVPNASILHRAEAAKEQDPNGGVTLWVKKDAALIYKMAPAQQAAQQALAYYFAGALQGGAAAGQAMPLGGPQTVLPAACPAQTVQCTIECTKAAPCPTHVATCVATCHATCPPHATCGATCAATCALHATCGITCIATCQATCVATCQATCAATCPPHATCGATCVATCHYTCAPICTHATPCRPTLNQPDCPYPSEICTHVAAQCTQAPNCRLPQAALAAMGAEAQVGCALGTIHASVQIACSIACPTRYVTCAAECWVTRYVTCNPECWVTRLCPIETAACPIETAACPIPGPGPVEQAQYCLAGTVRPPQVTLGGCQTIAGGCQSLACPSWQYSCGWGCPPRTPQCPW